MDSFFSIKNCNYYSCRTIETKTYSCGYCGSQVSSDKGYKIGKSLDGSGDQVGGIYICPNCQGPTFFTLDNRQLPGSTIGASINFVPEKLNNLYEEARKCFTNNCYTASVLLCRKMLMNIAVEKGAEEGLKFIEYVNYLSDSGYLPPDGKLWVDHIRTKGNEATHEIKLMGNQDAIDLITFVEMLLRFIYEFPGRIPKKENGVEIKKK